MKTTYIIAAVIGVAAIIYLTTMKPKTTTAKLPTDTGPPSPGTTGLTTTPSGIYIAPSPSGITFGLTGATAPGTSGSYQAGPGNSGTPGVGSPFGTSAQSSPSPLSSGSSSAPLPTPPSTYNANVPQTSIAPNVVLPTVVTGQSPYGPITEQGPITLGPFATEGDANSAAESWTQTVPAGTPSPQGYTTQAVTYSATSWDVIPPGTGSMNQSPNGYLVMITGTTG